MTDANPMADADPNAMRKAAPHNIEAEQALLGAILHNNEAYERVSDFLEPDHFFDPLHQQIFEAAGHMISKGQRVSAITLKTFFETAAPIDSTETVPQYLFRLVRNATTTVNACDYGQTIHDLSTRRHLILIAEDMINAAYNAPVNFPPKEQIEEAETRLFSLASSKGERRGSIDFRTAALEAAAMAEAAAKKGAGGISTGLMDLDKATGGLFPSDLIILAGRPSMGKTALAANIGVHVAKAGVVVDFASLEMAAAQVALRVLADELEVSAEKFRTGQASQKEVEALFRKAHDASLPLYIDETGGLTVAQLCARVRRQKRVFGTGFVIVDYVQLLKGMGKRSENRTAEVTEITNELKALAKELNVPILALSQLSRKVEDRPDKRPQLADLRDSGSIEQDADVVMFVFREEYYLAREKPSEEDTENFLAWQAKFGEQFEKVKGRADIIISKQRHGPICTVPMQFDAEHTKFSSLSLSGQAFNR